MAGLDEARARGALADMQDRLIRGPSVALGITANSTVEEARAAFLQLTKQYHPVRFGRMASDIQKQANEVFLALRAAHDTVAKTLRRGGPPGAAPSAAAPQAAAQAAAPHVAPGNGRGAPGQPPRPQAAPSTASALSGSGPRPAIGRAPGAAGPQGAASQPPQGAHGSSSGAAPAAAGAVGAGRAAGTARPAGSAPITARDEAAVIDLLQRQQWDQARSALHQLSARDPSSKRIRALECYARGREAQLDRRLDDARVELQDALDLDPDLQLAKTALTELFTRRK